MLCFFMLYNNVNHLFVVVQSQLCLTLFDPMDCSPPSSSVHGILQARTLEWVAISLLQRIIPSQGSNPGLLHCRRILYQLSHQGSLQEGQERALS